MSMKIDKENARKQTQQEPMCRQYTNKNKVARTRTFYFKNVRQTVAQDYKKARQSRQKFSSKNSVILV